MNRIYKVVWSRVKHCYVVVSELAKRDGKVTVRGMSRAAVMAAMVLTVGSGFIVPQVAEANYTNDYGTVVDATVGAANTHAGIAIGADTDATAKAGTVGIAIGAHVDATGETAQVEGKAAGIDPDGHDNTSNHGQAIAIGNNSTALGVQATALGDASHADNFGAVALGNNTHATQWDAMAIGSASEATGVRSTAIGTYARAQALNSTAIGKNSVANGSASIVIGVSATTGVANATDNSTAEESIAIGDASSVLSKQSIAIGEKASVGAGADNSMAIGDSASVTAANALALGTSSKAAYPRSVALGASSETGAAHTDTTATSYKLGNGTTVTYAGAATADNSTVSVGTAGSERQIQNVSAGQVSATSTDAINGSQLYKLANGLETEGLTFAGDTNTAGTTVALGNKVSVVGNGKTATAGFSSDNIMTDETADGTGAKVQILMSETPSFTSVKTGDTTIDTSGMTITNGPTITKTTVNVAENQITNVKDGDVSTTSTDAVNGSQLKSYTDAATTKVAGSDNVVVTATANTDKSTTYSVDLANTISVGKTHPVKVNGDDGVITGLTNTDWNNGKPVGYSADRAASEGELSGVQTEVTNVNTKVDAGWKATAQGNAVKTVTPADNTLNFEGDSKNVTVSNDNGAVKVSMSDTPSFTSTTIGNTVKISSTGIDNGGQKITNVKAGDVTLTSTDAVNGSQLKSYTDAATTTLIKGANTTLDTITNTDGSKTYKVDLANKIVVGDTNPVTIDGTKGDISVGSVTTYGNTGDKNANTILGLANTTWDGTATPGYAVNRAATEGELSGALTDLTNKGLTFGANSGAAVTKKLGESISVLGSAAKDGHSYSTDNLTTEVSTDGNITVKMDDSISAASVQVGKDGKDGSIGVAGKDGTDGVTITVKDGKNGAEGQIGLTGAAGKDGENATADIIVASGKDGVDGKNGANGMDRIEYTDHNTVTHEVATLDDGMVYGADNTTADATKLLKMKLNSQVNVKGGITDATKLSDSDNIGVIADGTDTLKVKLAKDLTGLNSVTTGDTVINTNGMTVTNGPTITKTTVSVADNKITNVKAGDINETSTDAINGSQLYKTEADLTNKGLNFGANSGGTVTNKLGSTVNIKGAGTKENTKYSGANLKTVVSQATDGTTTINVLMDKNITGDSVHVGGNGVDGSIGVAGMNGKDGVSISAHDGVNGTEGHIGLTGLPGKDGKDATADVIVKEGHTGVDGTDGKNGKDGMDRIEYTDHNNTTHEVATLDDGLKFKGDGEETIAKKLNETLAINGGADSTNLSDNNIGVVVKDGTLNVKLAKDLTGLTSVTTGDTTMNTDGITIKNGPTITKTVVNAADNKVTNVKDGDINKDSKDAVNGSQLYNATQDLTDKGLNFGANSGTTVTNKLGSTVNVVGEGTKEDVEYSGTNIKTKVSQATDGTTSIEVMMDKNITGDSVTVGGVGKDGAPGVDGSIGVKGSDGKDGVNVYAKNGVNGTEGHIGLTGLAGKDGKDAKADIIVKNGDVGVDGTDGKNGKDGMDRVVYTDHNDVTHQVATLDDGMKYGGDTGDTIALKLNSLLKVQGGVTDKTLLTDNNIGVVSDGTGTLNVKLSKELKGLTSTTYVDGDGQLGTTINNNGVSIENGDHDVNLTKTGLDNGGNTITNVAKGVNDTDAVNVAQLKDAAAAATTKVADGTNTTVKSEHNQDGSTTYHVNLNPSITLGTDPTKQVTIDGDNAKITAGTGDNAVSIDGTNGTVKAGKVTVDGTAGTVTGLTNTTWVPGETTPVSGRAATEDQLKSVSDVAYTASKQHTTIDNKDGNITIEQGTNKDGGINYTVGLTDNISVGGKTGKDGSIGVNGHDGTNGVNIYTKDGTDALGGNTGTEGHIGLTGPKGADGTNVTADIHVVNGPAGVNGKDGDNMTRVVYEDKDGTTHNVATLDDGMKYSGDTGSAAVKLDKNVSIIGETAQGANLTTGNIGVEASQDGDNAKLVVKLADDLTGIKNITTENLNSTTVNATTVNATTIKAGDTVTISKTGIDAGDTKITNVKNGDVYANSTDAVNGGQLYEAEVKTGNAINQLGSAFNDLDNRVNKVGAGAAALAALHPLDFDPDDKWDFAAGFGNYKGSNAAALGAYYRPNEDTMFSIGGTFGNGENMVNAGLSIKLGQGNHVSTSRVAMAKEMKDLRKEVENLRSALVNVSQGQRLDMTKMKLFPDIPANHWAYDAIKVLAGNHIVEGYPDGNFSGDRMMTRYEFAMIVYRAMQKGANVDGRLLNEFEPELERVRVDTIEKDKNGNPTIQRVRVIPGRG